MEPAVSTNLTGFVYSSVDILKKQHVVKDTLQYIQLVQIPLQ